MGRDMIKHPVVIRATGPVGASSCISGGVACWGKIYRAYASSMRVRHISRNRHAAGWHRFVEILTALETGMDADFSACRGVIAEFMKALESQELGYLSSALYRHLSVCGRCRAGMLLLTRGLDPRLCRHGAGYSCEQCQADLAAFIEIELDNPAQAAATYPHVWRHLWACWACARTYEYTHMLLAAERSGWLAPPQLLVGATQRPAPIIRRVRLTRQILALAIPRMAGVEDPGMHFL